jgi:hypothetical protein
MHNGTRETEEPSSPGNWTKLKHFYFLDNWHIWQWDRAAWKKTTTALISHPSYFEHVCNKNIANELFNSLVQSAKNACIWNNSGGKWCVFIKGCSNQIFSSFMLDSFLTWTAAFAPPPPLPIAITHVTPMTVAKTTNVQFRYYIYLQKFTKIISVLNISNLPSQITPAQ